MKKITAAAIALSAILFISISAEAQNNGPRNMQKRDPVNTNQQYGQQNDQYNRQNDNNQNGQWNDEYARKNDNDDYYQRNDSYNRGGGNDGYNQRFNRRHHRREFVFGGRNRRGNDRYGNDDRYNDYGRGNNCQKPQSRRF